MNYLVQGSARDVFGVAMRRTASLLGPDALWLPAHDEVIVAVDEARARQAQAALQAAFAIELGGGVSVLGEPIVLGRAWSKS